ncbi:MAG: ribonuclease HII, partial [Chloroflexota bacterium]|nr:ribonuclease HII [Chloroflexota bacterium]
MPSLNHEKALWEQGFLRVVGVDEVGMAALAGPVVAA